MDRMTKKSLRRALGKSGDEKERKERKEKKAEERKEITGKEEKKLEGRKERKGEEREGNRRKGRKEGRKRNWRSLDRTMVQIGLNMGHQNLHFPMSSGASE